MANFLIGATLSFVGGAIVSLFSPKRSQTVNQGKREQFNEIRSNYGDYIAKVWGIGRVGGILAWATFPPDEHIATQREPGKGGGGGTTTRTHTYTGNCAYIISEKITEITEIRLNGKLVYKDGGLDATIVGNACTVRLYTGSSSQSVDPIIQSYLGSEAIPYCHRAVVVFENLLLTEFGDSYPQLSAIIKNGSPKLSDIITDICLESPYLSSDKIDVSELTSIDVTGFQIERESTAAERLEQLQKIYFFDVVDTGNKLRFQQQYRSNSVAYIPPQELKVHQSGQDAPSLYTETKANLPDLPTQIEVKFLDKNNSLQPGLFRSPQFATAEHTNLETIDYSGALSADEAKTIATRTLWLYWTRAYSQELSVGLRYWPLEPGDVIEVEIGGVKRQLQINSLEFGANWQLILKTVGYNGLIYGFTETASVEFTDNFIVGETINLGTNNISGVIVSSEGTTYTEGVDYTIDSQAGKITPIEGGGLTTGQSVNVAFAGSATPREQTINTPQATTLKVIDVTRVKDDDPLGLYVFADGGPQWRGASLYVSRDNQNWSYQDNLLTRSTFGTLDADNGDSIDITLSPYAELGSIAPETVIFGDNRLVINQEILDFATATLTGTDANGNRQYTLTDLTRGIRGTYLDLPSHSAGDGVFYFGDYYYTIISSSADIGRTIYFKAVTPGQSLNDVAAVSIVVVGNALNVWIPKIDDFSPRQVEIGETVIMTGAGLNHVTKIEFFEGIEINLPSPNVVVESSKKISVVVPEGASTGIIKVYGPTTPIEGISSIIPLKIGYELPPWLIGGDDSYTEIDSPLTLTDSHHSKALIINSVNDFNIELSITKADFYCLLVNSSSNAIVLVADGLENLLDNVILPYNNAILYRHGNTETYTLIGNPTTRFNTESISANKTLTNASPEWQFLTPTGMLDVILPDSPRTGKKFKIVNAGDGSSGNLLNIKVGTTTILSLKNSDPFSRSCTCIYNGIEWFIFEDGFYQ